MSPGLSNSLNRFQRLGLNLISNGRGLRFLKDDVHIEGLTKDVFVTKTLDKNHEVLF